MQDYHLVKQGVSHEFCDYIRNTFKQNGAIDSNRAGWTTIDCYTHFTDSYIDYIKDNLSTYIPEDSIVTWINVSIYKTNEGLGPHKDNFSLRTIMCDISDNYTGGNFIIDNTTYIPTSKADIIYFNGYNTTHGVQTVESGVRYSLNIWSRPKVSKI